MQNYILLAFISTVLFGINTIIQKRATQVDPVTFTLISVGISYVCTLIYWLFCGQPRMCTVKGFNQSVLSGVVSAAAFLLFILALRVGKVSSVVIINAFSAAIAVLLAVLILSERLTVTQMVGVLLGIGSVILVSR